MTRGILHIILDLICRFNEKFSIIRINYKSIPVMKLSGFEGGKENLV